MDSDNQKTDEKITSSKATIIAAIIGGIFLLIATFITLIDKNCSNKSQLSLPQSPLGTKLDMTGWTQWSGLTLSQGKEINECIINSNGKIDDTAGFYNSGLDFLRGKTLILYFSNTAQSRFRNKRLVKLEYENGVVVIPSEAPMTKDGYLNAVDTPQDKGIEFVMTEQFAGRLNFVFYQADLKDLKITAWYR